MIFLIAVLMMITLIAGQPILGALMSIIGVVYLLASAWDDKEVRILGYIIGGSIAFLLLLSAT